jgi:hypothetical protein
MGLFRCDLTVLIFKFNNSKLKNKAYCQLAKQFKHDCFAIAVIFYIFVEL